MTPPSSPGVTDGATVVAVRRSAPAPSGSGVQVPSVQVLRSPLGGVPAGRTAHRQTTERLERLANLETETVSVISAKFKRYSGHDASHGDAVLLRLEKNERA